MAIQWIVFLHAGGFFGNERTEKYYDLTGSLTYLSTIALSLYLTPNLGVRQIILSSFVGVWAARLGWFLYSRIHNNAGIDSRFESIKKDNFKWMFAWTMQGVWIFTCLFPVLKLTQMTVAAPLAALDYAGFGLWTFGFIFEVIADYQKGKFRSIPENKNKFIDSGLWSISRHPNYFGEILLWSGISLAAYSATKSPAVFVTPVFVSLLLIYMSGIPMLEKSANEKFGNDPKFQEYKKNTPVLIPFIGRKGDADF
jgi:steroid 5-alpha reductase family enzyme